jgi:hypothetical protein
MINRDVLRWCIEELASRDEQERLWLGRSQNEMSSFEEAVCGVFDDSGLTRAFESGYLEKNYSDEFCGKVNELHRAIHSVPEKLRPQEIIDHPRMEKIRILAREMLEMLSKE